MKLYMLRALSLALFGMFLFVWEILVRIKYSKFFPSFSEVMETFLELTQNGVLVNAIIHSLCRFGIGLLLGGVSAIIIGLILGRFKSLEIILEPFIQLFRPISPIAWLPIIALWLGIGEIGAIFVIAYAVFFPVLFLSIAGVRQINPVLLEMARNFGANELVIFKNIILPGAFLHISSGLKLAASVAWIQLVAGEMLGIQSGLGYLIIDGRNLIRIDIIIVAMFCIGILGYIIHLCFVGIEGFIQKRLGG